MDWLTAVGSETFAKFDFVDCCFLEVFDLACAFSVRYKRSSTPARAIRTETVSSSLGVATSLGSSPGPKTYSEMFSGTSLNSLLEGACEHFPVPWGRVVLAEHDHEEFVGEWGEVVEVYAEALVARDWVWEDSDDEFFLCAVAYSFADFCHVVGDFFASPFEPA